MYKQKERERERERERQEVREKEKSGNEVSNRRQTCDIAFMGKQGA